MRLLNSSEIVKRFSSPSLQEEISVASSMNTNCEIGKVSSSDYCVGLTCDKKLCSEIYGWEADRFNSVSNGSRYIVYRRGEIVSP